MISPYKLGRKKTIRERAHWPLTARYPFFEESTSSIAALKLAYGAAPTIFFIAFTLPSDII